MAKKEFHNLNNPALQFMTLEKEENTIKKGRKPSVEETKTKRLNLLMYPSVCDNIEKIATMKRTSMNDLINSILKEYIDENKELIQKYDNVFNG